MDREFLRYIDSLVEYWEHEATVKSVHEKLHGLAFSILVALDGGAVEVGPFAVRSIDEDGNEGEDIAGSLHEKFCNMEQTE